MHEKNLAHVLENACDDPDCEIHNPLVGLEGGSNTKADLAFFIAGAYFMLDLVSNNLDNAFDAAIAEMKDQLAVNGR